MGGISNSSWGEKTNMIPRNLDSIQIGFTLKEAEEFMVYIRSRKEFDKKFHVLEEYTFKTYEYYKELRPDDKGIKDLDDPWAFTDLLVTYASEVINEQQIRENEVERPSKNDNELLKDLYFDKVQNDPLYEKRMRILKEWGKCRDKKDPNSFIPFYFSDDLLQIVIDEALYALGETNKEIHSGILDMLTKVAYHNFAEEHVDEPAYNQQGSKKEAATVTYVFQYARAVVREYGRRFQNSKDYEENTLKKIFFSPINISPYMEYH